MYLTKHHNTAVIFLFTLCKIDKIEWNLEWLSASKFDSIVFSHWTKSIRNKCILYQYQCMPTYLFSILLFSCRRKKKCKWKAETVCYCYRSTPSQWRATGRYHRRVGRRFECRRENETRRIRRNPVYTYTDAMSNSQHDEAGTNSGVVVSGPIYS